MKNSWKFSNAVGWVSTILYLAVAIYITVEIVSTGRDGAILFLLWIIFVGLVVLFALRTFHTKGPGSRR